jgi:LuxR family transcriptional regulator, maltose regulon positive regulatory protein
VEQAVALRNRARFVVPDVDPGIIVRTRVDDLYRSATGRVLRVLAPGGYGKSTIVSRWVGTDPRAVGWVDLELVDNDPFALLSALGEAMAGTCDLDVAAPPGGPRDADGVADSLARAVADSLARCTTPFVLVLDDIHTITSKQAEVVVDMVAEHLPPACTLVLVGRAHPLDGAVARLRLHPGVVDVGAQDLALTLEETGRLLAGLGARLTPQELSAVGERFEGWPAGLRLAGQALTRRPGQVPATVTEVAADGFVRSYLRSEWQAQLREEDTAFLREVACLRRFTAEMCDAVTGRPDSGGRLSDLHRDGLVVIPLDQRGEWYRMHPLLAGHLEAELQERDRRRWREIHLGAARWWERHGDIDLALDHADLAGDTELCRSLVAEHGMAYYTSGLHGTVRRWLGALPPEVVRSSAALASLGVMDAVHLGDVVRALRWSSVLRGIVEAPDAEAAADDPMRLRSMAVRATLEQRPARELVPLAQQAVDGLPPGSWRGIAALALGGLLFLTGDERAGARLDDAAFEAEMAQSPLTQANCLGARAILADLTGDRARATTAGEQAHRILRERQAELVPTTALVASMHSLSEARAGRREGAVQAVDLARRHLSGYREGGPWFNVLARLALLRTSLLLGDRSLSRQLLREVTEHLRYEPEDNGAAPHLAVLRAKVEAAEQVLPDGPWTMTAAEGKVLELLPTSLSLGDIAGRLFLSRNTVKSHTASIYRKLGATSRNQAVELARASGVLEEPAREQPVVRRAP